MTNLFITSALGAALAFAAPALSQEPAAATATAPAAGTTSTAPAAGTTAAAPAAAPLEIAAGQTIKDAQGGTVGTVEAVDAQNVTVATTKSKVKVPIQSFAKTPEGPVLGMTAAQLDAAAGPAGAAAATQSAGAATGGTPAGAAGAAATTTKLAKGATVSDPKGGRVGTVEEVSGEFATVATAKNKARLPKSAFADGADGVVIAMTEAELDSTVDAAKPKSASR